MIREGHNLPAQNLRRFPSVVAVGTLLSRPILAALFVGLTFFAAASSIQAQTQTRSKSQATSKSQAAAKPQTLPLELVNRWFTQYLYGIDSGVDKGPRSWIVREGERPSNPTAYPDYPHPDAKVVKLQLGGNGNKLGQLVHGAAPNDTPKTLTIVDDVSMKGARLAMAEESPNRLLFASPPLQEPLHISGTARITIKLSSSKPAANLSVWLVSLPWTERARITDNVVTRGWADPQNHKSLTESKPLVPGEFVTLSFDLQPDDQVLPVGAQLGLMIFSSDWDFTLRPPAGTELTVELGATALELPVVGGAEALKKAFGR